MTAGISSRTLNVRHSVEWPSTWRAVPLWSLFERIKDVGHSDKEMLSVYRDYGVVKKSSRDDNMNKTALNRDIYQLVDDGWLVVNRMKAWQGSVGISPYRGIVSGHYICYRPRHNEDPRFLNWLLRSAVYAAEYARLSRGVRPNQIEIDNDGLRVLSVHLPRLEEQRRIADFLDAQTDRIDSLSEVTRLQREALVERKSAVFHEAVREAGGPDLQDLDIDDRISNGWRTLQLHRALSVLTNGYVGPTRDLFIESGIKYLQSLHVKNGKLNFTRHPYYVPVEWAQNRQRISVLEGDLLIVQTGAIGEVALVDSEHAGSSCHALLIARSDRTVVEPDYLWLAFRSSWGRNVLLREQTGALHPHLEAGKVRDIKIPVPDILVQKKIIAECKAVVTGLESLDGKLELRSKLHAEMRQALITAAVTGQLDMTTGAGVEV
jgi:type I restriction enzyme S subunit